MNNTDQVLAVLAVAIFSLLLGFEFGRNYGQIEACASQKQEWHEDRCVTVTRTNNT